MSDHELMATVSSLFDSLVMLLVAYFVIVCIFLVTSWVAAGRMDWPATTIAIGLFSLATFLLAALTVLLAVDLLALGEVILQRVQAGESSLGWIGSAQRESTPPLVQVLVAVEGAMYLASLFFFFSRRDNRV